MKISALYARVSTAGQEKEQTIDSQVAEIETKAKQDGNIIGQDLKFVDDGWSGELLARPALDTLRDAVKAKLFDTLYIYDLGRLSRNFLNQLILKKELSEAGIKIISLHDINGENPESLLAQNVMGLFHDYERIKIAERFRRGKLYKAKNGILFGWQAPYGYKYVKGQEKGQGKFVVIPHEAEVIKKMFEWVGVEGLTVRKVIKRLYDNKIYPRKSKNGYWATSTISKRLRDEAYTGTAYYNKSISVMPENPYKNEKYKRIKKSSRKNKAKGEWFPISVPVIIDKELFQAVQRQMILNDSFSMRNKVNKYLLSGLTYCSCGRRRTGEGSSHTGHLYYRCTDRVLRYPLPKECHLSGVDATILDDSVWSEVVKLLSNKDLIKSQFKRWTEKNSKPKEDVDFLKQELEKQLDQFGVEEKRYLTAYGEGIITLEQYKERLDEIKTKKGKILTKLGQYNGDNSSHDSQPISLPPDLEDYCKKWAEVLENRTYEKKLPIIRNLVNKVTTDGKIARVQGQIPLEIPVEKTEENVEFKTEYRNRRTPKCRQINPVQCPSEETGGQRGQLPVLHHRAECRRN